MRLYLITGTTKGLGQSLALALGGQPDCEVVTLSRAPDAASGRTRNYYADLNRIEAIPDLLARALQDCQAATYQRIVLYNNAGVVTPVAPLAACPPDALEANIRVNLIAPLILMNQFIRRTSGMAPQRLVVNISSGAGKRPIAGWSAYCAAKAGLDMASRVVGLEASDPGLTVCSLAPGVVDTPMQLEVRSRSAAEFPDVARFQAMKEEGALRPPADVAAAILTLEAAGRFEHGGVHDIREMQS